MLFVDVWIASNNWLTERKEKGAHHFILRLAPFLFQVVESLYNQTRKLPLHHGQGGPNKEVSGSYVLTLSMFLSSDEYTTLRVILSLIGDIYNILTPLRDNKQLLELTPFIDELFEHANKFREVRNFFTHMNEIFTNMDKHGITGAKNTNCGITYTATAKGCVHLVWYKNVLYFTYQKKAYEITIDRCVFDPFFQIAKQIYSELTSHKIYSDQKSYRPVEELFPL
jgi:hypothetical protein